MKTVSSHLLRTFVTGALAALPLAATVFVFWWAVSLLWRWLGPGSAVGSVLSGIGLGVSGSEFVGYLMGLGIEAVAILLLGVLTVVGTLLSDFLLMWIDPRIRLGQLR